MNATIDSSLEKLAGLGTDVDDAMTTLNTLKTTLEGSTSQLGALANMKDTMDAGSIDCRFSKDFCWY